MGDYIFFYSSFHFHCVFFELNSGGALLYRIWASFPRSTTIHCNLSLPDRIFNIILCQVVVFGWPTIMAILYVPVSLLSRSIIPF